MPTIIKTLRRPIANMHYLPSIVSANINNYEVERSLKERRVMLNCGLPYITEEGLVLIDRREHTERRSVQCRH